MNDVTIIGTGPAGLTAAIYAARAGHNPVIYAGLQHGGQLTTTTDVENFPGFREGIMGPKLMEDMTAQAERVGATVEYEEITKVDFSSQPLKLWAGDKEILSKTVIICTGATAKYTGHPKEQSLMGKGISACATCDGFFYKNKPVLVIGGGDSAMEEAIYLANLCEKVTLIHRREVFKASNIMLERAKKHPKIEFLVPYVLDDILSNDMGVTGAVVKNPETNESKELNVDGIFVAIGHKPNSEVFLPYVKTDKAGYIETTKFTETGIPGVYAAGDIADPHFKQAITAAGMGCQAALLASKFIEQMES
ncbi:MAG: thioredoxin-disulfide reductase [Bdellovibrionota bacterium]